MESKLKWMVSMTAAAAGLMACGWGQPPKTSPATRPANANNYGIVVAADTTVFTGPLREDGTVDFIVAINARESRGIAADDNAGRLLARICEDDSPHGTDPSNIKISEELTMEHAALIRRLGLEENPHEDVYWNYWEGFKHPSPTAESTTKSDADPDDLLPSNDDIVRYQRTVDRPWSGVDEPEIVDWLKTNEKAFDLARRASERRQFWMPLVPPSGKDQIIDCHILYLTPWRNMSDGLLQRAMLKLKQGDKIGAYHDALTLVRLGSLLGQSGDIVTVQVGAGYCVHACSALGILLHYGAYPADQIRRMVTDLRDLRPMPAACSVVQRNGRYDFNDSVQDMAMKWGDVWAKKFGPGGDKAADQMLAADGIVAPDWNRALRFGNRFYDDYLLDYSTFTPEKRAARLAELRRRVSDLNKSVRESGFDDDHPSTEWMYPKPGETQGQYSGRIASVVLSMTITNLARADRSFVHTNEILDWTAQVTTALAIYRNDHGKYPDQLDAIIPQYLSALPANRFTTPIVYQRRGNGYILKHVPSTDAEDHRFVQADRELDEDVVIKVED